MVSFTWNLPGSITAPPKSSYRVHWAGALAGQMRMSAAIAAAIPKGCVMFIRLSLVALRA
jgi:hypothetical protein